MRYLMLLLVATACHSPLSPQSTASTRPPTPDAQLRNTRWVPREIAGRPITTAADSQEPYLLLRPEGPAEGNAGCNRFRGEAYSQKPGELRFGPLMSTKMACPALATESAFTAALSQTQAYRLSGDTLRLYDAQQQQLARLEAVYLQ